MAERYLLFRLCGPMASWGEVAVGEVRSSELRPTRSALLGLLAAALGLHRDDEDAQRELGRVLRFAVLVESAGVPLTDYHTAQVAPPRRGRRAFLRGDQLREPRHDLRTILSRREYRCDASYVVAVWQEEDSRWRLDQLEEALKNPMFTLYLGRKSCPPGLPLGPRTVEAGSLPDALAAASPMPDRIGLLRSARGDLDLYWEGAPELGDLQPAQTFTRRDDPLSRTRWSFRPRREHHAPVTLPRGEEGSDVPE